jgi:hypothetical protein
VATEVDDRADHLADDRADHLADHLADADTDAEAPIPGTVLVPEGADARETSAAVDRARRQAALAQRAPALLATLAGAGAGQPAA